MSALLQVEKLTAGYGMTPVLFEVDLELAGEEEPFRGVFIRAPIITST